MQIVLELKDPPSAESEVGSILRCFVHKLGLANRVSSKLLAVKKVEGSKGMYFFDKVKLDLSYNTKIKDIVA